MYWMMIAYDFYFLFVNILVILDKDRKVIGRNVETFIQ